MSRLTAKMVRSGLVTAWRLAGCPTSRSPSSVKATIEGVVRMPSAFSMTFGVLPSITATHELVVPRSIPVAFPMFSLPLFCGRSAGAFRHPMGRTQETRWPPLPTPKYTSMPPLGGLPAHIGEHLSAASHLITDSRARRLAAPHILAFDAG